MTEVSDVFPTPTISRRRFIVASATVGGGLALGVSLPTAALDPEGGEVFEPWLVMDPDNTVTIRVSSPEMGTGASTQLAMTIAEELECDWNDVKIEHPTLQADDQYDQVFSKSDTTYAWFSGRSTLNVRTEYLLRVGANARERLKQAAANVWQVPVAEVIAESGRLRHEASGREMRFGDVAARAATVDLTEEPRLKARSEWKLLGKRTPTRLQVPSITNGTAGYGLDVRVPGMRYAALCQCPVQDGKVRGVDFDAIRAMPGVRGLAVIEGGEPVRTTRYGVSQPGVFGDRRTSAVAVVADRYWQARKALEVLPIDWDFGEGVRWTSTEMVYDEARQLISRGDGVERLRTGDPEAVLAQQPRILEATYTTPYCDQAPMEPLNGTCLVTDERIDLWMPTQVTDQARAAVVEESGLDRSNIHVHQTMIGGAFGRRTSADDVRMVVAVAKQFPGTPMQVIWSREETMRQGRYRAAMTVSLKAGLDAHGFPQALIAHASARPLDASPPLRGWKEASPYVMGLADTPYAVALVPNVSVVTHDLPIHIRSGAYRGPHYNSNCFFLESFFDECARAAGIDELAYRLKLFEKWPDQGWSACLREAARQAGWGEPLPKGMARGIAIGNFGTYGYPFLATTAATVATVEVTPVGQLKVHALDVAFDCGSYLNLDAVLAQIEGATVHGYNMAMNESLSIENGRIVEGNFDRYPIVRMAEVPPIRVHTGAISGHERFAELGEVAAGPVGPAIANAIFKITGKRLRSTPISGHDLSWG